MLDQCEQNDAINVCAQPLQRSVVCSQRTAVLVVEILFGQRAAVVRGAGARGIAEPSAAEFAEIELRE